MKLLLSSLALLLVVTSVTPKPPSNPPSDPPPDSDPNPPPNSPPDSDPNPPPPPPPSASNGWSDEVNAKLDEYSEECAESTQITPELLEEAKKRTFPDDPVYKKFLLCLTQKTGMLDDNNKPVESNIRRKLKRVEGITDERVEEIMKKCVVEKETGEETAYYVAKCIDEEEPKFVPVDVDDVSGNPPPEGAPDENCSKNGWSDEVIAKLEEYSKECAECTDITPELLEEGKKRKYPDDPLYKKFMLCMTQKTGMLDDKFKPVESNILRKLKRIEGITDERVEEIMKKCVVEKETGQETAYYVAKCIEEEEPTFVPVDV